MPSARRLLALLKVSPANGCLRGAVTGTSTRSQEIRVAGNPPVRSPRLLLGRRGNADEDRHAVGAFFGVYKHQAARLSSAASPAETAQSSWGWRWRQAKSVRHCNCCRGASAHRHWVCHRSGERYANRQHFTDDHYADTHGFHSWERTAIVGKTHPTVKKTQPATTQPAESTSQAPSQAPAPSARAVTTPAAAPSPPAPPASKAPSCHPLTNGGNCYEPGEYCRNSDHGVSGVAGDGKAITCEDNDGWRWEPS